MRSHIQLTLLQQREVHLRQWVIRRAAGSFPERIGGGFQPAVEAATAGARRVFTLAPRFGPSSSGVWLNPTRMETQVLPAVAAALTAANPRAKGRYHNGEEDLYEKLLTTSG